MSQIPSEKGSSSSIVLLIACAVLGFAGIVGIGWLRKDAPLRESSVLSKASLAEDEAIQLAKHWLSQHVAPPPSITYNSVVPVNLKDVCVIKVDFHTFNESGVLRRDYRVIHISKGAGKVTSVEDASGKSLFSLVAGAQ